MDDVEIEPSKVPCFHCPHQKNLIDKALFIYVPWRLFASSLFTSKQYDHRRRTCTSSAKV
jgi:hypothetical protein